MTPTGPLAGRTVIVTREEPGPLGALLADRGAVMRHVPLIGTAEPVDGGASLGAELAHLDDYDWLVVSSRQGAERVGAAAATHPQVRLAAVGASTAARLGELAGRPVDLVPDTQRADALASELIRATSFPASVLVAAADRSDGRLVADLRGGGLSVTSVVAYRTVITPPDEAVMTELLETAEVLLLTSGSTAQGWAEAARGRRFPGIVVAIGPATAGVAEHVGLRVDAVAEDHSLSGLVAAAADSAEVRFG